MKNYPVFVGNIKKSKMVYSLPVTMVREKWNGFGLKGVFFDLNIEKALTTGDLHEAGRLLRNFGDFYFDSQEEGEGKGETFSNYEKSLARNLTRRKSLDTRENRRE